MSQVPEITPLLQNESFKYTPKSLIRSWEALETSLGSQSFQDILAGAHTDQEDLHNLWLQAQNKPEDLPFQMEYLPPGQVVPKVRQGSSVDLFKSVFEKGNLAGFRITFENSFKNQNIKITLGRGIGYLEFVIGNSVVGNLDLSLSSDAGLAGPESLMFINYQCLDHACVKVSESFTNCQNPSIIRVLNAELQPSSEFRHLLEFENSGLEYLRNQIAIHLNGEGAKGEILASFDQRQSQIVESETWVYHNHPHSLSKQLYKAVARDEAHTISLSHVHIAKGAVDSSAEQMNKTLMLSNTSKVDYKPFLDIHCDDVKATHGAAISRFQDEELFYLASRGISKEQALRLLETAFLKEVKDLFYE